MFENFLPVAIVIIVMWVGVLAYYLLTSRRQGDLQGNIESLRAMLDDDRQDA